MSEIRTETTPTLAEQERQADAELQLMFHLEQRAGDLPREIEAARKAARRGKVDAARRGESYAGDGVASLQDELEGLAEALFEARLRSAATALGVEERRIRELTPEIEAARARARPLIDAATEARRQADAASKRVLALRRALPPHLRRGPQSEPEEVREAAEEAQRLKEVATAAEAEASEAKLEQSRLEGRRRVASETAAQKKKLLRKVESRGVVPLG